MDCRDSHLPEAFSPCDVKAAISVFVEITARLPVDVEELERYIRDWDQVHALFTEELKNLNLKKYLNADDPSIRETFRKWYAEIFVRLIDTEKTVNRKIIDHCAVDQLDGSTFGEYVRRLRNPLNHRDFGITGPDS